MSDRLTSVAAFIKAVETKPRVFPYRAGRVRACVYSDDRKSVDLQRDALAAAGVDDRHLHQDRASGARDDRTGLKACLPDLRPGDVLIGWKLDRLGRSLPNLLDIISDLKTRGVGFHLLTEHIPPRHKASCCFRSSAPWPSTNAR